MKTKLNITEILLIVIFFVCMTLFNCAQHWEAVEGMAEYDAWQLQKQLSLDEVQTEQLRTINLTYYETLSKAYESAHNEATYCQRADAIVKERDQEISSLLTLQQRRMWKELEAHCSTATPCKRY